MKHYLLFVILVLLTSTTTAQFKIAVDAKVGECYSGVGVLYMPAPHQVIHLSAVSNYDRTRMRAACYYEEHYRFFNSKWLGYYGGTGIHLGSRLETRYYPDGEKQIVRTGKILFGTDLIGGFETTIPRTPIRVAVEVVPYIDLILQGSYIDGYLKVGLQF